jgi:hypothetical protein
MNGMGVLLVPITLNMAGVGAGVAHWLGLISCRLAGKRKVRC